MGIWIHVWWYIPYTPRSKRQRQVYFYVFMDSLGYRMSFRLTRFIARTCLTKQNLSKRDHIEKLTNEDLSMHACERFQCEKIFAVKPNEVCGFNRWDTHGIKRVGLLKVVFWLLYMCYGMHMYTQTHTHIK